MKTEARKTILFIVFTLLVLTLLAVDARADFGSNLSSMAFAGLVD
ncbi:hypothetical protein [Marinihelvus fidelis]|nr:hypothetical protein [Marinihelvus fidelis]